MNINLNNGEEGKAKQSALAPSVNYFKQNIDFDKYSPSFLPLYVITLILTGN